VTNKMQNKFFIVRSTINPNSIPFELFEGMVIVAVSNKGGRRSGRR